MILGFLQSATNPENGTVTYTYNTYNLLATKTDAKNQQLTYQYDYDNRLTSVTWANKPAGAQVLRTYYYDPNPLDSTGFSQYTTGRLATVQYPSQWSAQRVLGKLSRGIHAGRDGVVVVSAQHRAGTQRDRG